MPKAGVGRRQRRSKDSAWPAECPGGQPTGKRRVVGWNQRLDFQLGRNRSPIVLTRLSRKVDSAPVMKRYFSIFLLALSFGQLAAPRALGADAPPPPTASNAPSTAAANNTQAENTTKAAAAAAQARRSEPRPPDFLEYIVDSILERFDIRSGANTTSHF